MVAHYRVLSERLRDDIQALEQLVARAERSVKRAEQHPEDCDDFITSAASNMHSFYVGVERILTMIADEVDGGKPSTPNWHSELLKQMTLAIGDVRPAALAPETSQALIEYLRFRHVFRNVYIFELQHDRVAELVQGLRPCFENSRDDFLAFATFLDGLATADES